MFLVWDNQSYLRSQQSFIAQIKMCLTLSESAKSCLDHKVCGWGGGGLIGLIHLGQ